MTSFLREIHFNPKKNIRHLIYALSLLRGVYLILKKNLNPTALDHRIEGHHCCLESGLMRSCHHHLSRQWASHSFPARPNGPAGLYRRRWSPPVGEKSVEIAAENSAGWWNGKIDSHTIHGCLVYPPWMVQIWKTSVNIPYRWYGFSDWFGKIRFR